MVYNYTYIIHINYRKVKVVGKIGTGELILVLVIALVIFGPSKLPEIGKSFGQALGEFKSNVNKASSPDEPVSKKEEDKVEEEVKEEDKVE